MAEPKPRTTRTERGPLRDDAELTPVDVDGLGASIQQSVNIRSSLFATDMVNHTSPQAGHCSTGTSSWVPSAVRHVHTYRRKRWRGSSAREAASSLKGRGLTGDALIVNFSANLTLQCNHALQSRSHSMDLARPIRSAIPTGLVAPVLQALAQSNASSSLSEIHRRAAEGSLNGVKKVLNHLVTQGLVIHDPAGYRLNRDHLAADAVVSLAFLHKRFAERVRAWLADRGEDVVAAGIFGSMARRDGTADSDIDLLVVVGKQTPGDQLRDDLANVVRTWTGNEAHVLVLPRSQVAEVRRRQEPIVEAWKRDLQMLVGRRSEVIG